jgi:hypothetical protein
VTSRSALLVALHQCITHNPSIPSYPIRFVQCILFFFGIPKRGKKERNQKREVSIHVTDIKHVMRHAAEESIQADKRRSLS